MFVSFQERIYSFELKLFPQHHVMQFQTNLSVIANFLFIQFFCYLKFDIYLSLKFCTEIALSATILSSQKKLLQVISNFASDFSPITDHCNLLDCRVTSVWTWTNQSLYQGDKVRRKAKAFILLVINVVFFIGAEL